MSEAVTEIVYIPLKEGIDLDSGEPKEILDDTLKTIASQDGMKALYWGRQLEHPDTLQMVVEWENLKGHAAFQASPAYEPFLARLKTIFSDVPETLFHVNMLDLKASSNPLDELITECISAYFPPDADEEKYNTTWTKFRDEALKVEGIEARNLSGGWSIEPHKHTSVGEDVEGKMFASFIGWPTVKAHMDFRETEEFQRIIPFMRDGPKGYGMHHVTFKKY